MSTYSFIHRLSSAYITIYVTVYIVVVTTAAGSTEQDQINILPYLSNMTEIIESLNSTGIDYSNLLMEYSKICPSMIPQCGGPCTCNIWCWDDNACCPDCPYTFLKQGCFNVAILGEPAFHKLINECPLHFTGDIRLKDLCASNASEIAPVTFRELGFKNKHCAECYGLKDHEYEPWDMVLECEISLRPDLKLDNMLMETLKDFGCVAKFKHPRNSDAFPCNNDSERKKIDQCNVTGLMGEEDPGLRWACENLDSLPSFGMFKNVYCYLCNPSIASTATRPPLHGCRFNVTCDTDTFSKRLYPYGSACKAVCHGVGWGILMLDVNSVDTVDVLVLEKLDIYTGLSKMDIQIRFDDTNDILSAIKPFFTEVYGKDKLLKKNIFQKKIDDQHSLKDATPKKLHRIYTAICGESPICSHSFGGNDNNDNNSVDYYDKIWDIAAHVPYVKKHDVGKYNVEYANGQLIGVRFDYNISLPINVNPACRSGCSCDPYCLHTDSCCVDILLQKQPFSCYSYEDTHAIYFSKHKTSLTETPKHVAKQNVLYYSMVDKCLNDTSEYLNNMCMGTGNYVDSLSDISVTSGTVVFKNIYCLLCNMGWYMNGIRFKLECDSYLESDLFPDLRTMLLVARNSCETTFITDTKMPCKQEYKTDTFGEFYTREPAIPFTLSNVEVFKECNKTGLWIYHDVDIQEICEGESHSFLRLPEYRIESKVYKNFACYECNPEIRHEVDKNVISTCAEAHANDSGLMTSLCKRNSLHKRWYPYKNFYCAQCDQLPLKLLNIQESKKEIHYPPNPLPLDREEFKGKGFTYRNMFSLASVSRTEGLDDDGSSCAGIYYAEQNKCREFQCGQSRMLVNNTCKAIPISVQTYVPVDSLSPAKLSTYLMRIRVRPEQTVDGEIPHTVLLETLCNDLLNTIWESFRRKNIYVVFDCTVYNASCDEVSIPIGNLSYMALNYYVEVRESDVELVETLLVDALTGSYVIGTTHGSNVSLKASPVSKTERFYSNVSTCRFAIDNPFRSKTFSTLRYVDKFLNCPHLVVNETDVIIDSESGAITLRSDGTSFTKQDVDKVDNGFMICKEDYKSSKKRKKFIYESDNYGKAYKIFNDVCIILSLVCLLLTFITFNIFKKMRNTPGKNIMTLTFTLFLAQLFILIAPLLSTHMISCVTLGAFVHYIWLSTFTAMCACSFHMFKLFYMGSLSSPSSGSKYIVTKYNIFVFGVPLAIVSAYITYHMITGNGFTGYTGSYFCFIRGFYSLLLAFILPSLIISIASITLFSMSFHRIRTSPNMAGQRDRNDVMICIKLCIIVGITWPLQVVDGIIELSVLSFIVTGLNALQGVFIFIAYICNGRTAKLYKDLLFSKRSSASDSANTKSTQAPRSSTENDTSKSAV